jgi:exosortase/archaeosortase family protein
VTVASAESASVRAGSRLFGVHVELALAFSLLPVIRVWDLTNDINTAITTAALFAGSACLLWQLTAFRPPGSTAGAKSAAAVLLIASAWQLAWIDGNDFWFYRFALIAWGVAWLLFWWGWGGLRAGWRILAAFVIWAAACDGPWRWMRTAVQGGIDLGDLSTHATARTSAMILSLFGAHATVQANQIFVFGETVSVGLTCTSLPLTKLLWLLLLLATLLLRLPWKRAGLVALAATAIAFATSVVRVALLAYVAPNKTRFDYWHEPDSGGQWFTAAALVLVAWIFARSLPTDWRPPRSEGGSVPNAGRGIAIAGVVMLAIARFTTPPALISHYAGTAGDGYTVASDESESINLGTAGGGHPNEPAWIRRITLNSADAAQLELTLAYVPQLLAGDLRPELGDWKIDPSGKFARLGGPKRVIWVATLSENSALATSDGWNRKIDDGTSDPRRWMQWLAHQRALRDKRAFWAEAIWTGPAGREPAAPPAPFSQWIGL